MGDLPNVALSINQPWASLIAYGAKDIENRDWPTNFRGEFLIHAGLKRDGETQDDVDAGIHPLTGYALDIIPASYGRGGIIGIAEIVDCVSRSDSPWFVGRYGFVIRNARPIALIPCVGALGFFRPDYTKLYKPKAERIKTPRPVKAVLPPEPDLFGQEGSEPADGALGHQDRSVHAEPLPQTPSGRDQ